MHVTINAMLALLVSGCATPQPARMAAQPVHYRAVHAPPGWQSFCFPLPFRFAGATDTIANDPGMIRAVLDMYHDIQWFHLQVAAGGEASRPAPAGLAERRAQAIVQMLSSLGVRADRVEVELVSELSLFEPDSAYLTAMIPPEEVERQRIDRETRGLIVC